jgi:hypothetical protein
MEQNEKNDDDGEKPFNQFISCFLKDNNLGSAAADRKSQCLISILAYQLLYEQGRLFDAERMKRKRHAGRERETERDRQAETDRDRQRQTETDRD